MKISLLEGSRAELNSLSERLGLALSDEEMEDLRGYFSSKGREPTEVELQSFGQAWSEHCCYKSSKTCLKEHIFGINAPQNISIISEDAGVVEFDDDHAYVLALESHNHPSAIEPYGGAATGIGGIVRDVVCMGAQPVAFVDPLFFASLDHPKATPKGVKHPRYIFEKVVEGIRDYGNRIGIPTVSGLTYFDPGFLGNPIVNVGCLGIVEKKRVMPSRVKYEGDLFVLIGGRTGRDGIHGVTFASEVLTEDSEEGSRGAVQVGDPITKEAVIHVCLELCEKELLNGLKDLGGGGLSCVVGEMALAGGFGAEVDLENVPLKDPTLNPWEIWVSESQERMMLSISPKDLEEVMYILDKWDVEGNVIGKAVSGSSVVVYNKGEKVLDLDLDYLTGGPEYARPYVVRSGYSYEELPTLVPQKVFETMLSNPLVVSKEWVVRQYDHEVRGNTVIKPLQGVTGMECHGDASIIKPLEGSFRGLAITADANPAMTELDPFRGAA